MDQMCCSRHDRKGLSRIEKNIKGKMEEEGISAGYSMDVYADRSFDYEKRLFHTNEYNW